MNPLTTQVGGNHYKDLVIQPIEYIVKNNLPYMEGNIVKYITRWRKKNGIQDLQKVIHYTQMLIEFEQRKASCADDELAQGWAV